MDHDTFFQWMKQFFLASGCSLLEEHANVATVQLTEEMDSLLMNRPFYWQYVKKTNQQGIPQTFSFTTDIQHSTKEIEYIHPGSFRFERLKKYMKKHAAFIQLYETTSTPTSLHPWLNVNFKLQYRTNTMKEETHSWGIHLISGKIVSYFLEQTDSFSFQPAIPSYHFTLTPLIKWPYGIQRIEHLILQGLEKKEKKWIHEATERLTREIELLQRFYKEDDPLFQKEKKAIIERLSPHIQLSFINIGLFYLSPFSTNILIQKKTPFT
ncbi:YqhG family protein [Massilibacterium senegalense]|uniref:YqhG family protein n=1 Tax=Massilibacterium senegalense TaxID=1632858 RepID=UPI00078030D2|nr:YqhG family protein [Massilibacterium senegalense]